MRPTLLFLIGVAIVLVVAGSWWFTQLGTVPPGSAPENGAPQESGSTTGASKPATENTQRIAVDAPSSEAAAASGTNVLRVVLQEITEEKARLVNVTVAAFDSSKHRTSKVRESWPCRGTTSEFDLDSYFAALAERSEDMRADEFKIAIRHPLHFSERVRVPFSSGVELPNGQTVYEVRVKIAEAVFWPEFELAVRDKHTRAHLEDVELRFVDTNYMGLWQQPGSTYPYFVLGSGLSSPIALRGGRKADTRETHADGIALRPAVGDGPRPVELDGASENARGIMMYARAPGYAWGRIVLDVSKNASRELLLEASSALRVRFANVQFDGYAELDKPATICVGAIGPDGGVGGVFFQRLDEKLATEGVLIENLKPGEHAVSVELGHAFSWRKRHVLKREEVSLAAGKLHEVMLVLADSPGPPELTTLGGTLSFPAFGGEKDVRLWLYKADYKYGKPDFEQSLADMNSVGSALPTWSFRFEDLPVGRYQARVMPFDKSWMIEVPAGGRHDLKFEFPELAEVFVETVKAGTGELAPLEQLRYGLYQELPDRIHQEWSSQRNTIRFEGEPGRFRFWTIPGAAFIRTFAIRDELDIYSGSMDLELKPGLQSVRFGLATAYSVLFEFRVGGDALPREDSVFWGLSGNIRAIGHEGRMGPRTYCLFEASAPGLYEVSFEGPGFDRFRAIPPRQIDVRGKELMKVIVDLERK